MLCPEIDNPVSREIRAVMHFLRAISTSGAEIHRELCAVCDQNVMSEGAIIWVNKCSR
jgi:hypothetical protein